MTMSSLSETPRKNSHETFWPWVSSASFVWKVHKFGGSSVANADCFRQVAKNVLNSVHMTNLKHTRTAVVVSALGGITDKFLQCISMAVAQDKSYLKCLEEIVQRHFNLIENLFVVETSAADETRTQKKKLQNMIVVSQGYIAELLRAIFLSGHRYFEEMIIGHGEIWCTQLMAEYFNYLNINADWLDARQIIIVKKDENQTVAPEIIWERSQRNIDDWFQYKGKDIDITIITGFIASYSNGEPTTLKRNGSDYSASIFGYLLRATDITIWTDVNGVYTCDPRLVSNAQLIEELSYTEAVEMAFYGAKIIHPKTMAPAIKGNVPLYIKNTFNPDCSGTKIHANLSNANEQIVRGLTLQGDLSLITIFMRAEEHRSKDYTPLRDRNNLMSTLSNFNIPIVSIAQAAPMHSICLCVRSEYTKEAEEAVRQSFLDQQSPVIETTGGYSVVTAVGDSINKVSGVAADFFGSFAKENVNVLGIAQNGERIVSVLVKDQDARKALRTLHRQFFVPLNIVSIGIIAQDTQIARDIANQIAIRSIHVKKRCAITIKVECIYIVDEDQSYSYQNGELHENKDINSQNLMSFADRLNCYSHHFIIIDSTQNKYMKYYKKWIDVGARMISGNLNSLCSEKTQEPESTELFTDSIVMEFFDSALNGINYSLSAVLSPLNLICDLQRLFDSGDQLSSLKFSITSSRNISEKEKMRMNRVYLNNVLIEYSENKDISFWQALEIPVNSKKFNRICEFYRDEINIFYKRIQIVRHICGLDLEKKQIAVKNEFLNALFAFFEQRQNFSEFDEIEKLAYLHLRSKSGTPVIVSSAYEDDSNDNPYIYIDYENFDPQESTSVCISKWGWKHVETRKNGDASDIYGSNTFINSLINDCMVLARNAHGHKKLMHQPHGDTGKHNRIKQLDPNY